MVPPYNDITGEFNFTAVPSVIKVSEHLNVKETRSKKHASFKFKYSDKERETIRKYFEVAGVKEEALQNSLAERCKANIFFYKKMQDAGIEVDPTVYLRSTESFF